MRLHSTVAQPFVLLLILLVASTRELPAQAGEPGARNAIYVELLGNAVLFGSINYDRMLSENISVRVGASPLLALAMGNYLTGSGNSRLEIGLGVSRLYRREIGPGSQREGPPEQYQYEVCEQQGECRTVEVPERITVAPMGTATVGYRYQPRGGGLLLRVGLTPIIGRHGITPWVGASLGLAF